MLLEERLQQALEREAALNAEVDALRDSVRIGERKIAKAEADACREQAAAAAQVLINRRYAVSLRDRRGEIPCATDIFRLVYFSLSGRINLIVCLMLERTILVLHVPDFVGKILAGAYEELAGPGIPIRNVAERRADQS